MQIEFYVKQECKVPETSFSLVEIPGTSLIRGLEEYFQVNSDEISENKLILTKFANNLSS